MGRFITTICLLLLFCNAVSCQNDDEEFSEVSKIALRDIGNRLMISNQDSTSLILPITKIDKHKYQLEFQKHLAIEPDSLVLIVKNSFKKANLPDEYRVEVIHNATKEVAYSYEIKNNEENSIIPCNGRNLPTDSYRIQIRFLNARNPYAMDYLSIAAIAFLGFGCVYGYKQTKTNDEKDDSFSRIGHYKFYPEHNKLKYKMKEINLSKKECELLEILSENLNEVVKRDELTKRIWEDHGVFVGRSLDTYVSKLRKKFENDASIKITNIHSVGYKLEVI